MQTSALLWNPITLETTPKPLPSQLAPDAIILDGFIFQQMPSSYDSTRSKVLQALQTLDMNSVETFITIRREALVIIKKFLDGCCKLATEQVQEEQTQLRLLMKVFKQIPQPIDSIIKEVL